MTPAIGFVLLTHQKPYQIIRLVSKINSMFDHPPIVCHHDFSKCSLDTRDFTRNVSFVYPHLETKWADFSLVEATVRSLEQMYSAPYDPEWCVLLSGADYPIKPSWRILQDLNEGSYDAHIKHEPIKFNEYHRKWHNMCFDRYCTKKLMIPYVNRKLNISHRLIRLRHPALTRMFLPFSDGFRCFAGSQWFCANRRSSNYIIEFHNTKNDLTDYYRKLRFADESYFQTILANAPDLRLNAYNWRFTDWSKERRPLKVLRYEDLPRLLSRSNRAHFARKFDVDVDRKVIEELDGIIK